MWTIDYVRKVAYFTDDVSLNDMANCLVDHIPEDGDFKITIHGSRGNPAYEGDSRSPICDSGD